MSGTRKLLIFGGLALALWGMGWGLAYAVFFEHQMLDRMGGQISSGFMHAAERNMPAADAALGAYAHSQFNYVRQVDVHSHWIGLAMVLIVLGIAFDRLAFDDRKRFCLALLLVVGSVISAGRHLADGDGRGLAVGPGSDRRGPGYRGTRRGRPRLRPPILNLSPIRDGAAASAAAWREFTIAGLAARWGPAKRSRSGGKGECTLVRFAITVPLL